MATEDILTLAEAKRALRISLHDTATDDMLAQYVTAATGVLEEYYGPVVAVPVTGEVHYPVAGAVILAYRPVRSITTVTEYRAGVGTVLAAHSTTPAANTYWPCPYEPSPSLYSGILYRRAHGYPAVWDVGSGEPVAVTYSAGRFATTAGVAPRWKRACGLVLANLWRERDPGVETLGEYEAPRLSFPTFALPNAVKDMLPRELGQAEPWGIA